MPLNVFLHIITKFQENCTVNNSIDLLNRTLPLKTMAYFLEIVHSVISTTDKKHVMSYFFK